MRQSSVLAAAVVGFASLVAPATCIPSLLKSNNPFDVSNIIAHEGTEIGLVEEYDGGKSRYTSIPEWLRCTAPILTMLAVDMYVTGVQSDLAVLYITDVFGIQLQNNKL